MKAALIGAGQIARQHLACLQTLPGVEVAGVCDLSPAVAEAAAERYGVGRWFTDHRKMLDEVKPDVVHVTTPPTSHAKLSQDAIDAGAHVVVEKPITASWAEYEALAAYAAAKGRALVEDHNYVFNSAPQEILRRVESGELGKVVHVDVLICLDILGPDGFADPNVRNPILAVPGGAIADFLPHLASLAHAFVGGHTEAHGMWGKRRPGVLPFDEFHGLVQGERGTATLGFSSTSQPDGFWLRVYGEKQQATANLFETRLTFTKVRPGPKPLVPLKNGLEEGKETRRAAMNTLLRKFKKTPGAYEGLWELLRRTYAALQAGGRLPVGPEEVRAVNEMVEALKPRQAAGEVRS